MVSVNDSIPLSQPSITQAEIDAVTAVLRSGRLSIGPELERFESLVAQRAGRSHGVGVSSGTAGMHLALLAMNIGPGDEVITPAFSFVASANCIEYTGATPVFVDCDPRTLNMAPEAIAEHVTDRTRAVVAVDVFGNPAGMAQIEAVCNRFELPLVEDCCEALGSKLHGRPAGGFGRVGVFSFYPNKQITTGEGGVIVTDDDRLANLCRSLRNQGRALGDTEMPPSEGGTPLGSWLTHVRLGFNYRLSEIHAALGRAQIQRLDELIAARQRVVDAYTRRLGGNTDLLLPTADSAIEMSWFVYVVRLSDQFSEDDRDAIIDGLRRHDVGASNYFPPIPLQPFYRSKYGFMPGRFPVAESVGSRCLALPLYPGLTDTDIDLVCQTLELMIRRVTFAERA